MQGVLETGQGVLEPVCDLEACAFLTMIATV